ncbi:hypothetical protein ARTHRO9AX_200038 [Arthrobacter sp. 9AX]|nr:hypothetical protein ARTHRO9AX_200038 [Arthrobacter sp. 9AX]
MLTILHESPWFDQTFGYPGANSTRTCNFDAAKRWRTRDFGCASDFSRRFCFCASPASPSLPPPAIVIPVAWTCPFLNLRDWSQKKHPVETFQQPRRGKL